MSAVDNVISEIAKAKVEAKPRSVAPSQRAANIQEHLTHALPLAHIKSKIVKPTSATKPSLASASHTRAAPYGTGTTFPSPLAPIPPSGDKPGDDGHLSGETHSQAAVVSTIPAKRGASKRAIQVTHTRGVVPASTTLSDEAVTDKQPRKDAPHQNADEARGSTNSTKTAPRRQSIRRKADSVSGPSVCESQVTLAADAPHSVADQTLGDTHHRRVGDGEGVVDQLGPANQALRVINPLIDSIVFNWRLRQRWHKAEKSLVLQAKALLRSLSDGDKEKANENFDKAYAAYAKKRRPEGYDPFDIMSAAIGDEIAFALAPLIISVNQIELRREDIEKRLAGYTKQLPVWSWVDGIHGFGLNTLASIVGECGDIGSYKSVSAVWKRMGLAVISGGRQRKVADAEAALEHGYSPPRRAVAYLLGQWLIMAGEKNPYRELYDSRKAFEMLRCEAIAADPEQIKKYSRSGKYAPKAHANNRAARYMVKRVLRELYAAWRAIERGEEPRRPGQSSNETHSWHAGAESFPMAAE